MKGISNNVIIKCFFIILFNFIYTLTWASTFYVDKDNLGGKCSDSSSNSGSTTKPWCTITYGTSKLKKGDTLYVRKGTYSEIVTISTIGDKDNRVTVAGYPGERPIIDGEYKIPNRGSCTSYEDCSPGDNCDENYNVCGNGECDPKSGNCYNWNSLIKITGEYITVENFEVKRSFGGGIQVEETSGNSIIRNCWSHDNRISGICIYKAKPHHVIDNCKVYNNCNFAPYSRGSGELDWPGGIAWRTTEDVTVKNCEVFNNWGEGILPMWTNNVKILNNVVYDNYAVQIYGDAAYNVLVEGNLVFNSGDATFFRGSRPCSGIYFTDEPKVCNNTKLWTNNIKIINNLVAGNNNNIVVSGGCKKNQTINSLIANNTSVDPLTTTIKIVGYNGAVAKSHIVNNIFCQNDKMSIVVENKSTIEFSDNIWSHTPPFPSNIKHPEFTTDAPKVKVIIIDNPQLKDLNKIVTIKPKEKIEAHWFELLSTSPARNKAVELEDVVKDYFGVQKGEHSDIGAVEYIEVNSIIRQPKNLHGTRSD